VIPEILYDEDGHPTLISTTFAATRRQATRTYLEHSHDGALFDYFVTVDVHGDGSRYRPKFTGYREAVRGLGRVWYCPSPDEWEGGDVWNRCKAVGLTGAAGNPE